MVLQSSGQISINQIHYGEFGRGTALSSYRGTSYYFNGGSGFFRSGDYIAMSDFYGKSPDDEWNCACNCNCPSNCNCDCNCTTDCNCNCGGPTDCNCNCVTNCNCKDCNCGGG